MSRSRHVASGRTAVIDTGANLASLGAALDRLGADWRVTTSAIEIRRADRLILPGVGSAAPAMRRLREHGLDGELARTDKPVLGICLGMQLLAEHSAEGGVACLGLIPGRAVRLEPGGDLPVPHMGWNRLRLVADTPLLAGLDDGEHCYYVHSYALPVNGASLGTCEYGQSFSAVAGNGRAFGVQFHPERSGPAGARILENFLAIP